MRILVIKPSSLGDIVHAMVVVSSLKLQRPDVVIDWIVGDRFWDIVAQSGIAFRILRYERHGGIVSFFHLISEIRHCHYDYVFDMQGLARSGLMTFFAKSSHKIGRKDAREFSRLAYSRTVSHPGFGHAIDILKGFLDIVGCKTEVSGLVPELENIHSPSFETFLRREILPNQFICIFPESRRREKEWSFFLPLVKKISEQRKHTAILLMGSQPHCEYAISSPLCFDLFGKTSLSDTVFLIKNAQLVIANDSGPLHISAALGRNTLGLFTATDPVRFGPYPSHKNHNRVLCLKNLPHEVDSVTQVALEMLSR
ncbi:MAG: glycosyltransferase family 9 protein [Puniceicoccales bacterium]|jgi:ADP-heptose:LPS heptosyltransferase|nr:glycosyltransferase family 9 protein [Puniceicoccales bacterium]